MQVLKWDYEKNTIHCKCTKLQRLTFANTFDYAPNAVDFATVFLRFSPKNQTAVLGTIVSIFVLYAVSVVILRRKDKADRLAVSILFMYM